MLRETPSVSTRWDNAARILERFPDKAFRIIHQPSHAEAVELLEAPENDHIRIDTSRRIISYAVRGRAVPRALHIAETVSRNALEYWLAPGGAEQLVCNGLGLEDVLSIITRWGSVRGL